MPIRVPSLAERREDIPELVQFFVEQVATSMGIAPRRIAADASAVLQSHDWPGNIRQLRNNIERLMILVAGDPEAEITAAMLPAEIGAWQYLERTVRDLVTSYGYEEMRVPIVEHTALFKRSICDAVASALRMITGVSRS